MRYRYFNAGTCDHGLKFSLGQMRSGVDEVVKEIFRLRKHVSQFMIQFNQ